MPKRAVLAINKRTVDGLRVEDKDTVFWDRDLPGFGIRVYASGRKIYTVQSRGPNGIRRVSLGRHGDLTPNEARRQAVETIDRIKRGEGRARVAVPVLTVADLAKRYMEMHVETNCNAHTRGTYRGSLDNHILPALGEKAVAEVSRTDASALHYDLRDTPRAANRALMVLSKMFTLAEAWGLAPPGSNPCRHVIRFKERKRERFLNKDEYRRVGIAICELEGRGPLHARAAAALRLLMLTGCRRTEVLTLRWDDVDLKTGEIRLRDAKTGSRKLVLTAAALRVLSAVHRARGSRWVFAGKNPKCHMSTLARYWRFVRKRAGVEDVTIHDLRHSYASRALALGESLTMIGRLLGHRDVGSTARYAHLARDAEKVAVARVGDSIEADILRIDTMPVAEDGAGEEGAGPPVPDVAAQTGGIA